MGLFDFIQSELIDIVEWIDDTKHTLVWRFPRHDNEIKNGAQLIVRPGQMAVFVYQGEIADVYPPGHYELTTANMPVMTSLQGWKYGFDSPFKAEVYFVSTTQITDMKWGTPNPIMLRDPEFGPIRLRAFGTYSLKAIEPKALLKEIVGTDGDFSSDDINTFMRSMIQSTFADLIGSSKIAALDLASNYAALGETLRKSVVERIDDEYGLDCPALFIVNISLPESVEKALDTRTSMGVIGDLNRFQQYQMGQAMTAAAEGGGGGAADGLGLGLGVAMAGRMLPGAMGGVAGGAAPAAASGPPPVPAADAWYVAVAGESKGPYTTAQMQSGIASSEVSAETLVWKQGMPAWVAAGTIAPLSAAFAQSTPPPIPGS
ncbi:SPFH domain-containing protein [Neorhodopirellula lusitana]|uniref:SPFH domain-containing protein n=1 Tax=Neorhodopirellula lusitana TaxID=445327 RepID=UPI00385032FF